MPTLREMVHQVQGHLNQYAVNRASTCTFEDWKLDGANKVGVKLKDVASGDKLNNVLVELETGELVHLTSYDPNSKEAVCPAWFRAQLGTPQVETVTANSRAVIEPLWPTYHVALKIIDGINQLYPDLFVVKDTQFTSSAINGNYDFALATPAATDVDGILHVTIEVPGPSKKQFKIAEWSLDTSNTDGKKYLRTNPSGLAGRPIYVTYRAKPVVPSASSLSATWASTGLPDSAADLPVLYAAYTLITNADLAKTQMHSMEQSDRNRFVQSGAANAASRRLEEMFQRRLNEERRKLLNRYPPRLHKELSG